MKHVVTESLRDGVHSGGTAFLLREIRKLGATASVAKTGRVTVVTADGERRVYSPKDDFSKITRSRCEQIEALGNQSPLQLALSDLERR